MPMSAVKNKKKSTKWVEENQKVKLFLFGLDEAGISEMQNWSAA